MKKKKNIIFDINIRSSIKTKEKKGLDLIEKIITYSLHNI